MTGRRHDVIVIGAGPAGLMCAARAAMRGKDVLILEKNERPARKLLITGKGRCNITNDCTREEFIAAVRRGGKFLYSALSAFSPQDMMALMEELGVPVKTERGARVFPISDKSVDVVDALVAYAKRGGAVIKNHACSGLIIGENGAVEGVETHTGRRYLADAVVITTGGASYPQTGSTGDGYAFARSAGHTVTSVRPSLVPVEATESWCKKAMGLSLRNVTLTVRDKAGKTVFHELGELLFTHFGLSGPLVLSASAHMDGDVTGYRMIIDLKPGLSEQKLDERLLRDFGENINRDFFNSLGALLPRKLIPIVVNLSGIDGAAKVHQITRTQRLALVHVLKGLTITPKRLRPIEEAIVTSGGVSTAEIDPRTMRSKLAAGLYFAGELLDIDAYTGGFNLQIAYSTGYLAGENC